MLVSQRPFLLLLIAALLTGQWVYAAHSHHEGALDSDHSCQLCLHGAQFDSFVPGVPFATPTLTPDRSFHSHVQTTWQTPHARYHDSRAPPHS